MKKLEKIIKEAILEVIAEGNKLYTLKNQSDSAEGLPSTLIPDPATEKQPAFIAKYKPVSEGELDEMSMDPVLYKIGNEKKVKDVFSSLSGKVQQTYQNVIDVVKNKGTIKKSDLAIALGKTTTNKKGEIVGQQPVINPIVNALEASGILVKVAGSGVASSRVNKATGEIAPKEEKPETFEPEDIFIGNKLSNRPQRPDSTPEEVAASFARARAAGDGGEEKFVANLKKDAPKVKYTISNEDYDKLEKFWDYNERLRKIDSALRQNKKISRGGDDMISKDRGEAEKLSNIKTDLENRIKDLVAGSEYLQNRKAPEDKNKNR